MKFSRLVTNLIIPCIFLISQGPLLSQENGSCIYLDVSKYETYNESKKIEAIKKYRDIINPFLKKCKKRLIELFSYADPMEQQFNISSRLKTVKSIKEKFERKKKEGKAYKCFTSMRDIAGLRVVTPSYSEMSFVVNKIRSETIWKVLKVDTIINYSPDNIYRAIHIDIDIEGYPAEIQIITRRGNIIADASHVLTYKGPYKKNTSVVSYLENLSNYVLYRDNNISRNLPVYPDNIPRAAHKCLSIVTQQIEQVLHTGSFTYENLCTLKISEPKSEAIVDSPFSAEELNLMTELQNLDIYDYADHLLELFNPQ